MPKDKPREQNRKDVWLTDEDAQNVEQVIEMMRQEGVKPGREGKYSLSQVFRFTLGRVVKKK